MAPIIALTLAAVLGGAPGDAPGQEGRPGTSGNQAFQHPARRIELSPRIGPPGTRVTVRATLLPAITPVQLAIGGTHSGFEALAVALTDTEGNLVETVEVPSWAQRDRSHRFIVFNLYFTAVLAESGLFHVTDADGTVVREGEIGTSGAACPVLEGDDGDLYRLTGETEALAVGARVVVEGTLSESEEGCGEDLSLNLKLASVTVQAARDSGAAGAWLYVCNQDDATVSVIDMGTNTVLRTVDLQQLGFSANAKPHHVAVEPDGSYWYVTLIGDNHIVKLDRDDRVVASVEFETPGMLALHPTEDYLFVGRSMTAVNPPQRIGVIKRSTMELDEQDIFFPRPHALALQPSTNTVYTASLGVNQLAAVDFEAEDLRLIDVAGEPHALMQFAVSPHGDMLAISAELSHNVMLIDISEPMEPRITDVIDVGAQPFDPIFTLDGRWLYLGNKAANTVTVIDVGSRSVSRVIEGEGIAQPHGVALSPDGKYVYVSNNNTSATHDMAAMAGGEHAAHDAAPAASRNGTVVVIDTTAQSIVKVIEVGRNATGMGARTRRSP